MSTNYLSDLFMRAGTSHYGDDYSLNAIIEAQIADAFATLDDFVVSECLVADIARYLLRAIRLLSELAHGMAYGEHVDLYLSRKVRQMEAFDGFDNMLMLDGLNQKEKFLKSIASHIHHLEKDIKKEINIHPGLSTVFANSGARSMAAFTTTDPGTNSTSSSSGWHPTNLATTAPSQAVEQDTNEAMTMGDGAQSMNSIEEQQVEEILQSLSTRGKGQHYCPYGVQCKFGGVDADRNLVLFERNSYFRAHLQKHTRPFKCNQSNCTNKKGFARIDQLIRHQQVVHHM